MHSISSTNVSDSAGEQSKITDNPTNNIRIGKQILQAVSRPPSGESFHKSSLIIELSNIIK